MQGKCDECKKIYSHDLDRSKFSDTIVLVKIHVHTKKMIHYVDMYLILDALMHERGLSKKQFAEALGRRPSEITKWLSGQHNFTLSTLAMLSSFFRQPIITVG